jgi:hypothetical protein
VAITVPLGNLIGCEKVTARRLDAVTRSGCEIAIKKELRDFGDNSHAQRHKTCSREIEYDPERLAKTVGSAIRPLFAFSRMARRSRRCNSSTR